MAGSAAIGAAEQGVRDFAEAFAAPADHFDLLFQAQKFFDDCPLQFEGPRAVRSQNIGHWASLAQIGPPRG